MFVIFTRYFYWFLSVYKSWEILLIVKYRMNEKNLSH